VTKVAAVLLLTRERCSAAEIAIGLAMDVRNVRAIVRAGWWPGRAPMATRGVGRLRDRGRVYHARVRAA
jgi:hypothetical protein